MNITTASTTTNQAFQKCAGFFSMITKVLPHVALKSENVFCA